jgi:hypothetical protein
MPLYPCRRKAKRLGGRARQSGFGECSNRGPEALRQGAGGPPRVPAPRRPLARAPAGAVDYCRPARLRSLPGLRFNYLGWPSITHSSLPQRGSASGRQGSRVAGAAMPYIISVTILVTQAARPRDRGPPISARCAIYSPPAVRHGWACSPGHRGRARSGRRRGPGGRA